MIAVVKPFFSISSGPKLRPSYLFFLADPSPLPLGGAITLSCVEPLDSHHPDPPGPPQMSARGSIACPQKSSRTFAEKVSGVLKAASGSVGSPTLFRNDEANVAAFADL